jgi:CHAT domain-containing protein
MKKLPILTICLLSIASTFPTPKALATPSEIFARAAVGQNQQSNELADLERQAQQAYEAEKFTSAIELLQRLVTTYTSKGNQLAQVRTLRNLALVYYQTGERSKAASAIVESFNQIKVIENSWERTKILAQILEVKGQLELSGGQSEQALETWKQAGDAYQQISDATGTTKTEIDRAQAMQVLGLYNRAIATLTSVEQNLKNQPDSLLKAKGLQSLGEALRVVGELERSQTVLQQSLSVAEKVRSTEASAATLISLGNLARVRQQPKDAIDFYQRAIDTSNLPNTQIQALLNQLSLLIEQNQPSRAQILADRIQPLVAKMPPSRTAVYAKINLARSWFKIKQQANKEIGRSTNFNYQDTADLLADSVQVSQSLQDQKAEAYALGNLGKLYEENKQLNEARKLTEKALFLAQSASASDIAYQWQWQLGRILNNQGEKAGAIAAYTQSVKILQSLRSDLVNISSDVQFSFKESVEPVYRELVSLLLQPPLNIPTAKGSQGVVMRGEIEQSALIQARQTIESLQVAELDNFFRDACSRVRPVEIDKIDPKAAVFYPIILGDRLEVIVRLPGKPLEHYTAFVGEAEVEGTLRKMRIALTRNLPQPFLTSFLEPSQRVYNWLIRPIEADLVASGVETLVFISDGSLRNIPMASLHSGEQYLAEKYSIAVAPALQLVDAKPLARNKIKILTGGLSEARQGFDALPGVELELQNISVEFPTTKLLNNSFTESNLQSAIKSVPFSIIHLATHGQFSSKAENTFILAWDDRINALKLKNLLQGDGKGEKRAIELLVLSACKTALGDRRATLGLAGVAVRAGARSTLASLWYVSDDATAALMTQFYQELAKSQTTGKAIAKAEALRRAQQALIRDSRFSHPYFWSAFVLVGNWL